jgi:hypothetical protein
LRKQHYARRIRRIRIRYAQDLAQPGVFVENALAACVKLVGQAYYGPGRYIPGLGKGFCQCIDAVVDRVDLRPEKINYAVLEFDVIGLGLFIVKASVRTSSFSFLKLRFSFARVSS